MDEEKYPARLTHGLQVTTEGRPKRRWSSAVKATPLTVEKAQLLCKTNETDYKVKTTEESFLKATGLEDHEFVFVPEEEHPTAVEELKESSCSLN
ncbi:hypothetical protein Avbf_18196 [Armadillidium vulgare]|nr:hypothetical protein Avbf_18196 [Armadillidium vulgare]